MMAGVRYEGITDKGLIIIDKEGRRQTIAADGIVPTLPLAPDNRLFQSLTGKVSEIYAVGDCREPQLIPEAIADGWRTANKI
jgi:hypothetical protein